MRKNKQSARSLTAFIVTWAFIVLSFTGVILYIVPHGRVAYWVHWSLAGMEKDQWGWIHMMFGGVFIVSGILHLYYNWNPFKKYFAARIKGHLELKQEIFVATILTVVIFVVSALNLPPASWVIDLNSWIKSTWVTSPGLEPPFGHAEEASLAGISRKMHLDLDKVLKELVNNGIQFEDKKDTLEDIAHQNDATPMAIYGMIKKHKQSETRSNLSTPEDIEVEFSGSGLGRKNIAEIAQEVGLDLDESLDRLSKAGISAVADDNARKIAEKYEKSPIDILVIMMLGDQ